MKIQVSTHTEVLGLKLDVLGTFENGAWTWQAKTNAEPAYRTIPAEQLTADLRRDFANLLDRAAKPLRPTF